MVPEWTLKFVVTVNVENVGSYVVLNVAVEV